MRKIATLLTLGLALHLGAAAQDHLYRPDTAEMLVDRYIDLMNTDAMPPDSVLQLRTVISTEGVRDTFVMRRWYAAPLMHRIEVWKDGRMHTAICSNGKDRFRMYKPDLGYWVDIPADVFYERLGGYDFRGPLYGWRAQNARLTYDGRVDAMGRGTLQSVLVRTPMRYDRHYMFEPSGLLAFIHETGEMDTTEFKPYEASRIEMKFMHEYQQVGPMILPMTESFVRHGRVTVLRTEAALIPRDNMIFNQDRPQEQPSVKPSGDGHTARP